MLIKIKHKTGINKYGEAYVNLNQISELVERNLPYSEYQPHLYDLTMASGHNYLITEETKQLLISHMHFKEKV